VVTRRAVELYADRVAVGSAEGDRAAAHGRIGSRGYLIGEVEEDVVEISSARPVATSTFDPTCAAEWQVDLKGHKSAGREEVVGERAGMCQSERRRPLHCADVQPIQHTREARAALVVSHRRLKGIWIEVGIA